MTSERRRPPPLSTSPRPIYRYHGGQATPVTDLVTVEEPLEIRVVAEIRGRRRSHTIAVTMRTPGEDVELATGFLVSEGVVRHPTDLWKIEHCRQGENPIDENVVEAHLAPAVEFDLENLSRNVLTSSACGICGRSSIDSIQQICAARPQGDFQLPAEIVSGLPAILEQAQGVFAYTGGIHAAGLFTPTGELLRLHEDVGRHNAVDKLVGKTLVDGGLPAAQTLVVVSGRASFELVQKALLAGIPMLAAVGAPSSLAIDLAVEYGMTLVGFLRPDRFNVYCGGERIVGG